MMMFNCRILADRVHIVPAICRGDAHVTKSHIKMASTISHIAEQCENTNGGEFRMAGVQDVGGQRYERKVNEDYL